MLIILKIKLQLIFTLLASVRLFFAERFRIYSLVREDGKQEGLI
jgi:hypothetical protein